MPVGVDKAARIFCVTSSSSGSCSGRSEVVARNRNANSSKVGSGTNDIIALKAIENAQKACDQQLEISFKGPLKEMRA